MTLAIVILLINLSWAPVCADPSYQSAPTATSAAQDQASPSQQSPADTKQTTPSATPAKPSATQPQQAKKPVHRKKKTMPAGCEAAVTSGQHATTRSPANQAGATAQNTGNASPPTNCPPPKIVVRHGGSTEPSIQLAGGPGGNDDSQKRDATTQMLGTTENNLKKLSDQQLSESQQDSVRQIRQFMEQSKTALASGDSERARTLAWKAELLSEDLVKPKQ